MRVIILAGGPGNRLAGYAKALIPFGPQRLVQWHGKVFSSLGWPWWVVAYPWWAKEIEPFVPGHTIASSKGQAGRALAAMWSADNYLLLEEDVLFDPRLLNEWDGSFAAWVGEQESCDKVDVQDGRILGKGGNVAFLGALFIPAHLVAKARSLFERNPGADCLDALGSLLAEEPLRPWFVRNVININTQKDSLRAHMDLWPLVK